MKTAIRAAPLALLILLLGFPQLSETIYAPALTEIALAYRVSAGQAQLTMSVYFLAFAFGVVCWGRCADLYGRRPALLAALLCYGAGAGLAWLSRDFTVLLLARLLLAFGASAGSVVVQTMLRDRYQDRRCWRCSPRSARCCPCRRRWARCWALCWWPVSAIWACSPHWARWPCCC